MGWVKGLEPSATRATTWCSNQLSYTHHKSAFYSMARLEGLEPPTYGLEGRCSILLSYRRSEHINTIKTVPCQIVISFGKFVF